MIIGIPKEIKEQEQRVALLPSAASQLTKRGHSVVVQKNAGIGSGYPDEEYVKAGAEIVDQAKEVFTRADMVVKVKEPLEVEFQLMRKGQILFTYLHLAASKSLTEALLKSGVTAVAYETIQINHRLPLLEPMSEIAGRMSAVMGANFLAKYNGGSGVLLGGVPGVLPGRVVVVGGGTSGVNAARIATGLGAEVIILDVDLERLRYLDLAMENTNTVYSSEANLQDLMADCDLLIGAVLLPGAKAPKLITRPMLRKMKPGSVLVDISIDQGGCAETSRPTTHLDPVYVEEGVTHYCVANMPAAYARTATQALTNVTFRYVELLADLGLEGACKKQPALTGGINTRDGRLTCKAVAEAHGLKYEVPL
ncbi:MAG TPA: alanine dehydrogenase [Candidatus Udaeobacter sp.]|nr:MAG: alanine dehydrogenase [Verrucomicrobiota bacterium]PYL32947.1 MAG: alanine dehydrogenase [Verrucomicrobiota bacterium]HMC26064.1 alanine dehydrogenase [Candidatus Udaeobacter sp.]